MKIPFDIKFRPQIESGEYKVVTGDDRPVQIISWEKKVFGGRFEIVALVPTPQGDTEAVQLYCPDGTLVASLWNEKFKLFIITPEPKLTNWQTYISGCLQKHGLLDCSAADRIAKECSAELLDLARKEIMDGWKTMDRATKVAVEKYPHGTFDGEIGDSMRAACAVGYMQAEKDLALTKDDVWCIFNLVRELQTKYPATEGCLQEVADIFNEQRKKN